MRQERSEVLVIGAGPAGCAAGIVLARAGVEVCVVDRATFPRDKTCGDALSNDGMSLAEELGARDAVEAGPHAVVRRVQAIFPDGSCVGRDYERPGYIVPRLHLDDCLRRVLEASGARLLQGVGVAALTAREGRVCGAEGPDLRLTAKVVIAADGYGSVGLPVLGVPRPRGERLAISATAYCKNVRFPGGADVADHYFDRELPYGYGWIFPAVEGISNIGVYLRANAYARTGLTLKELLNDFIERKASRLHGLEMVGRPRVWSLPIAVKRTKVSGVGLLLAGDAAGFVDPLSGEGIFQALHSGMLAGRTAADAVRSGELEHALAARYEQACERDIGRSSRAKALVQAGMAFIVEHGLYRLRLVRSALAFGYQHHALEITKS